MTRSAGVRFGRRQARQELKSLRCGGVAFGCVDQQRQARVRHELQLFVAEGDLTDSVVVEALHPDRVLPHVVCAPADAELVAAGRELADKVLQPAVEGVATCLGAKDRDDDVRRGRPVGIERVRALVEEGEARDVASPRSVKNLVIEDPTQGVGRQDVHPAVAHERGTPGDRIEHQLQTWAGRPALWLPARLAEYVPCRGARQVEQV